MLSKAHVETFTCYTAVPYLRCDNVGRYKDRTRPTYVDFGYMIHVDYTGELKGYSVTVMGDRISDENVVDLAKPIIATVAPHVKPELRAAFASRVVSAGAISEGGWDYSISEQTARLFSAKRTEFTSMSR